MAAWKGVHELLFPLLCPRFDAASAHVVVLCGDRPGDVPSLVDAATAEFQVGPDWVSSMQIVDKVNAFATTKQYVLFFLSPKRHRVRRCSS